MPLAYFCCSQSSKSHICLQYDTNNLKLTNISSLLFFVPVGCPESLRCNLMKFPIPSRLVSIFPLIDESKSALLLIFETSCLSFSFLYSVSSKRNLAYLSFGNPYIPDTNANRALSILNYIPSSIHNFGYHYLFQQSKNHNFPQYDRLPH